MVLPDAQVVGGDARVLPAVERLGHVDLQRSVLMDDVVLAVLDADLTVFEPAEVAAHCCHILSSSVAAGYE